jgi:protein-tyrosine phosphatase
MPGYGDGDVELALKDWNTLRNLLGEDRLTLVALVSEAEIGRKSPDYAKSLREGRWLGTRLEHPLPDFGVPADEAAFYELVETLATKITRGGVVVIHCAAGIGRTGTAAVCVLLALRVPLESALAQVQSAGSGPETPEQEAFVRRYAKHLVRR